MKLTLKRVGCISEAVIEPGEFTVFCGANNTGKTYAMYVLWSVLERRFRETLPCMKDLVERLSSEKVSLLFKDLAAVEIGIISKDMSDLITRYLPQLFGASEARFSHAQVVVNLNDRLVPDAIKWYP
jgi:predicted ATPase